MTAAQYRALAKLHTRMSDIYFNEAMKLEAAKAAISIKKKKKAVKKKAVKKKSAVKHRHIQLR